MEDKIMGLFCIMILSTMILSYSCLLSLCEFLYFIAV